MSASVTYHLQRRETNKYKIYSSVSFKREVTDNRQKFTKEKRIILPLRGENIAFFSSFQKRKKFAHSNWKFFLWISIIELTFRIWRVFEWIRRRCRRRRVWSRSWWRSNLSRRSCRTSRASRANLSSRRWRAIGNVNRVLQVKHGILGRHWWEGYPSLWRTSRPRAKNCKPLNSLAIKIS